MLARTLFLGFGSAMGAKAIQTWWSARSILCTISHPSLKNQAPLIAKSWYALFCTVSHSRHEELIKAVFFLKPDSEVHLYIHVNYPRALMPQCPRCSRRKYWISWMSSFNVFPLGSYQWSSIHLVSLSKSRHVWATSVLKNALPWFFDHW